MNIKTPHLPLGISLEEGLKILTSISSEIEKHDDENDNFYKIKFSDFECGFYENTGKVISSWYNDPTGRESEEGINQKVSLYLSRYGDIEEWEDGINNGWIQFFTNNKANVGMAYGLHKDVIRFNHFE